MLTPQQPIPPSLDLRDMLRQRIIGRSLTAMTEAAHRPKASLASGDVAGYRASIRAAGRGFYGALPNTLSDP